MSESNIMKAAEDALAGIISQVITRGYEIMDLRAKLDGLTQDQEADVSRLREMEAEFLRLFGEKPKNALHGRVTAMKAEGWLVAPDLAENLQ